MNRRSLCFLVYILTLSAQNYPDDSYQYGGQDLSPLERRGRDTWYFWTGGNEKFWRHTAGITNGVTDLLMYADSRQRPKRFATMGVLNDPDCTAATVPDEFGIWLDSCKPVDIGDIPGQSTGIIGLRRFPNPKFDKPTWSLEKYLADPKSVEPPYLVGMTCGFCHIAFNPLNPPADPEKPYWRNLAPAAGNQYFKEGTLFTLKLKSTDFRWHVGSTQPPGTSDTSRFATDHIFNPNAINSVVNLANRPSVNETMNDGSQRSVHHILKDGADSIGTAGASLRVYVNIGMCSDYWITLHDPIYGIKRQQAPFRIELARKDCPEWRQTEERMPAAEAFLKTLKPLLLKDAPGGSQHLSTDQELLRRGALAFAEHCARCHSSKQPPAGTADAVAWFRNAVVQPDFATDNFLSDDKRYSVSVLGTNSARAMASNATPGHVWEEFSSKTYKELPAAEELKGLYNPVKPSKPIDWKPPAGGRGYYRTPTLAGVWSSAPYLHNNSIGLFNNDPSVLGRIAAYNDAMEKMLWPEKRLGVKSIYVTSQDSTLPLEGGRELKITKGTPVNLFGRINAPELTALRNDNFIARIIAKLIGKGGLRDNLLRRSLVPDFVEDRGHTFGSSASDQDKRALIEYLKTL